MLQGMGGFRESFFTWLFASILGFGALGVLALFLPGIVAGLVPTTLVIALPIGLAQWIALRRLLPTSPLWILTVPLGMLLGFLLIQVIPSALWPSADDESIVNMTFIGFLVGFSIGLVQWFVLRRGLLRSSLWVLGSSIAVAAGFWLILVTGLINRSGIIAFIVAALLYSIITGLFLSALLANRSPSQADQPEMA